MNKKIIGLILVSALTAASGFAASTQPTPEATALINKISQDKLSVLSTFSGPGNLDGFVLQPNSGQPIIMYADQKGEYVVYGTVLGKDGANITDQDTEKYIKKYTALKIADNLAETTHVVEGSDKAPYKIIVLADPNCSACHYAYNAMKPFIDNGQLQVKWVFVYFVRPDSQAKAAAIMSAKNPGKAMAENEAGFDMKTEEGGITALKNIPQTISDELQGNMKFMQDTGISSTPTIIYYDQAGELQFISGAPSDFASFLKEKAPGSDATKQPIWWAQLKSHVS